MSKLEKEQLLIDDCRSKIALIRKEISNMTFTAISKGMNNDEVVEILLPYYSLIEELYEKEIPIAKLLDNSDLIIQLQGKAVERPAPKMLLFQ